MTSKSDKITMRETLQIHWRAFKDIRRYCPGAFGVSVLYGTAAALSPYVTVYLSARIINELAGARRLEVLGPLAILAVASGALLTFVTGALLRFCAEAGAMIALETDDPETPEVRKLGEFALAAGNAFQLRDDYLGIFGNFEMLGKSLGGDLREGKISIKTPIAQGLLNKKVGDEVEIKIPRGTIKLRIDKITVE